MTESERRAEQKSIEPSQIRDVVSQAVVNTRRSVLHPQAALMAPLLGIALMGAACVDKSPSPTDTANQAPARSSVDNRTADNRVATQLIVSPSPIPEVQRPEGIDPEKWKTLTPQKKKEVAEDRARIRANADIVAGREPTPSATLIPEGTPDRFKTAIVIAGTPPTEPYEGPKGTGMGRTGIGAVDAVLTGVDVAWIAVKFAVGFGLIVLILKKGPGIVLKAGWEVAKLPFRIVGGVGSFLWKHGREVVGRPSRRRLPEDVNDEYYEPR